MDQFDQNKRNSDIKKLVSNAKAVLSHQRAIPLGCQTMTKILYWINQTGPITEIDLSVFSKYDNEVDDLPIGTERLSYNKDYLIEQDIDLDIITMRYKTQIIEKCFEIIKNYDKPDS